MNSTTNGGGPPLISIILKRSFSPGFFLSDFERASSGRCGIISLSPAGWPFHVISLCPIMNRELGI
jgi:hypothetical protein